MGITFHCDYCGKEIKAADSAGGKWGKCPACHNKLYVPNLNVDADLELAPVDTSDIEKQKELMAETYKLTQDILQEREPPEGAEEAAGPASEMNEKDLTKNIILCLRQMADGELDESQKIAASIAPRGTAAVEILDRIAVSEMPEPELADIPPQVLSGLIRMLRSKIT